MKMTNVAVGLALAALAWGYYQGRRVAELAERLENVRASHFRMTDQLRDGMESLQNEVRALRAQLRAAGGEPLFTPEMSVGEATRLDGRVSQVLAAFHIGGCDSCAVSDSDTLAYAAVGNGQDVDQLLATLNRLNGPESGDVMQMLDRKPNVRIDL